MYLSKTRSTSESSRPITPEEEEEEGDQNLVAARRRIHARSSLGLTELDGREDSAFEDIGEAFPDNARLLLLGRERGKVIEVGLARVFALELAGQEERQAGGVGAVYARVRMRGKSARRNLGRPTWRTQLVIFEDLSGRLEVVHLRVFALSLFVELGHRQERDWSSPEQRHGRPSVRPSLFTDDNRKMRKSRRASCS